MDSIAISMDNFAFDPLRHWPIILVGFLGKVFGPIGFLYSALSNQLPWHFGLLNLVNDIIWLIPFGLILKYAYKYNSSRQ